MSNTLTVYRYLIQPLLKDQNYPFNIRRNQFILSGNYCFVFYGEVCEIRCSTFLQKGSLLFLLNSPETAFMAVNDDDVPLCVFDTDVKGDQNLTCTLWKPVR